MAGVVQHERVESSSSNRHNWSRQCRHIRLSIQVQAKGLDHTIAAQEQSVLHASSHRHISEILRQRRDAGFTLTIQADGYHSTALQQQRVVPPCTEPPLRQRTLSPLPQALHAALAAQWQGQQRSGSSQVAGQRGVQEFLQGLLQQRLRKICCRSQADQELQVIHG